MSIKPIDFQVSVPKTTEFSRIQNEEQQKYALQKQQALVTTQHKVEDQLRQVYSQDKINEVRIRLDEKRKDERQRNESKNKKNNQDKNNQSKESNEKGKEFGAGKIDIRI